MRKIVLACALALVCPLAVYAVEPGSEALPFIKIVTDASRLGMGGAGLSGAVPFALEDNRSLDAHVGYVSWMPEVSTTNYVDLGAAFRTGNLALSLEGFRGSGEKITGTTFTPASIYVKGGAAYKITDFLSAGASVAYAKEDLLADYSYSAVAADVFVAGKYAGWNFAAGVSSLGSAVTSDSTGDFSIPTSLVLDGGYSAAFGVHVIKLDATMDYFFSGTLSAAIGAEYCFNNMISARVGYREGGESVVPSFASAGLGLCFNGFCIDAAYLFASDVLGGGFGLRVGYRF